MTRCDAGLAGVVEHVAEARRADCLWHVYRMIGKPSGLVHLLSKP